MELGHSVKSVVLGMPFLFRGHPKVRAGEERLASRKLGAQALPSIGIKSDAFAQGGYIPAKYTAADGENITPPLRWSGIPSTAKCIAVLVEDPDAPTPNPFVHWIAVFSPTAAGAPEGHAGAVREGRNTMMRSGWYGCAPPKGDDPHHYHFQVFALDRDLDVGAHPGRHALFEAMKGHVLAFGELVGVYQR